MKSRILYMVFAIYAVIFFGGNAVRSLADGHIVIGCLLLAGALGGVVFACHIKDEADREETERRKDTERQLRGMNSRHE